MTQIFHINPSQISYSELEQAARIVKQGGLIVFPTETVYALGALAGHKQAVQRIFDLKGRTSSKVLPLMPPSRNFVKRLVEDYNRTIETALQALWPGPLTVVMKTSSLGRQLTFGQKTVALRWPDHPVALGLLAAVGEPLAATSANLSGQASFISGDAAAGFFEGKVEVVINSGVSSWSRESTIVDVTVSPPKILRQGTLRSRQVLNLLHG